MADTSEVSSKASEELQEIEVTTSDKGASDEAIESAYDEMDEVLSSSSEDYDDEKRTAAEVFRTCLIQAVTKSGPTPKHAVKEWWKKGSIAASRNLHSEEGGDKPGRDEEGGAVAELEWRTENLKPVHSASEEMKHIRKEANRKPSKELVEKYKTVKWWMDQEAAGRKKNQQGWLDMPSTEITDTVKRDLEVLSMRDTLDPKRHYKSLGDLKEVKWLHVGTILDNPLDGKSGRLPRKLRKRTIAEQWLADPELKEKRERRMNNIQAERDLEDKIRRANYPGMKRKKQRR